MKSSGFLRLYVGMDTSNNQSIQGAMANETFDLEAETRQHVPHDIVFKIPLLMRYACVCKALPSTITSNRCFPRKHHRLQELHVLIAPRVRSSIGDRGGAPLHMTTPGLYRWERKIW
jgi:hypothetical protein